MIAGTSPGAQGPKGPSGKGEQGESGHEGDRGTGHGLQAGNTSGENGQGGSGTGNLANAQGPLNSAPHAVIEQFFQPADGKAALSHGPDQGGNKNQAASPRLMDAPGSGAKMQAAKQLDTAVQRIERGRELRAKAANIWRDDPRRLQQFRDW
jgi:hypothetical protein